MLDLLLGFKLLVADIFAATIAMARNPKVAGSNPAVTNMLCS